MNSAHRPGLAEATVEHLRQAHARRKAERAELERLKAENAELRAAIRAHRDKYPGTVPGATDAELYAVLEKVAP